MIYLDNAATSYPKPRSVLSAAGTANRNFAFNSGRGGYAESVLSAQKIFDVRIKIADFFGCQPQNVAFTSNCTSALNTAIKGLVKKGDHVLLSSLEHNAVYRPVYKLHAAGLIDYDMVDYSPDAEVFLQNIRRAEKANTSMVIMLYASNVFGVVHPVHAVGEYCKRKGWHFVLDAAQSAGILPLNMAEANVTALCAPGHKGLYGIMGTGFLAVQEGVLPDSLMEGGTGSNSYDPMQPDFLPDRLEAGTLNNPGILALGAGLDFINKTGIKALHTYEMHLTRYLYEELKKIDGATLYTSFEALGVPVLSFNYKDYSSEAVAAHLAQKRIAVRAGYHCAPCAHHFFGTDERGTVRLSPSVFTTSKECEYFLNSLKNMD